MNKEFAVHMLNDTGKKKATQIAEAFDLLLNTLAPADAPTSDQVLCPQGRELALVKTKLEEAAFFAKKAMASAAGNSDPA